MDIKRVATTLIGLPIVAAVLVFANKYIVDVLIAAIALIAMHEFLNAISKKSKPIRWICYTACISIAFIHIIPMEYFNLIITTVIAVIMLILFLHVISSRMDISFKDIAYTFFGIFYIAFFMMFFAAIRGMENGNVLIWYAVISSWATDIFAYLIGKHFGKHKFSKISPKKTIEGCIGGTVGALVIVLLYTYLVNTFLGMNYSYIQIGAIAFVLSIISQIGDFAASSIKRYVDVKDYSELIPGHGGMLDRIDSLLFIAPFAYVMFNFIVLTTRAGL